MRLSDADARLHALILERMRCGFAWGVRDCAVWAFDAAQAVTGTDRVADLRGRYASARGAVRLLSGFGGLAGLVAARMGSSPCPPPHAVRHGDIALLSLSICAPGGLGALGVAWQGYLLAQGAQGLVAVPAAHALRWWSH